MKIKSEVYNPFHTIFSKPQMVDATATSITLKQNIFCIFLSVKIKIHNFHFNMKRPVCKVYNPFHTIFSKPQMVNATATSITLKWDKPHRIGGSALQGYQVKTN